MGCLSFLGGGADMLWPLLLALFYSFSDLSMADDDEQVVGRTTTMASASHTTDAAGSPPTLWDFFPQSSSRGPWY